MDVSIKMIPSSYALKNRCLRWSKRYLRHWFHWYWILVYLILMLMVFASFTVIWWSLVFNDDGNDPTKPVHIPLVIASHNIVQSAAINESNLGLINDQEDQQKKDEGFRRYAFNSLVSERLGFRRQQLPDTRHHLCHNRTYPESNHLNTSVIICFFNEEFHTLIRTVNSILDRTPKQLLAEILLVDDSSEDDLNSQIESYRNQNPDFATKVRYIRTPERSGLIRARNYAAQFARGRIFFFLDSHCEVNQQWLEPILDRIARNRTTVACPIIDLIDPDTFHYRPSPLVKGGFNWALHFRWDSVPNEDLVIPDDFVKPIESPAMAGGLFAIDRDYFFELGSYDSGMNIWGAENVEFSLRIWMCGGRLEIVPCSRVGHIFRKRRPYDSPDGQDTLAYNSLRTAHVWLDDYIRNFLATRSDLKDMEYGNVQDRIELRKRLRCRSFEWYLENIYPTLLLEAKHKSSKVSLKPPKTYNLFPRKLPRIEDKFLVRLNGTNLCLQADSELSYKNSRVRLDRCYPGSRRQVWHRTEIGELRIGAKGCLDAAQSKNLVRVGKCHEMGATQKWLPRPANSTTVKLYNDGTGLCLGILTPLSSLSELSNDSQQSIKISMSFCTKTLSISETNAFLHWNLVRKDEKF